MDGLRGLAVLAVVIFHLGHGLLPGGYLGVDVFFVLSGYLITSIVLVEHGRTGRIDLGRFWLRRSRRLLPALLSLMPAVALYAWTMASADELVGLRRDALATLAYVANWRAIFAEKSYWDLFASPSLLEHTWSLAIEEQFYVVWPLVLVLVLQRLKWGARGVGLLAAALALGSMASMLWRFDPDDTARVYFGTDTRAAAILFGVMFAVYTHEGAGRNWASGGVRWLDAAGALSLLGLAIACWCLEGTDPRLYRGGFWLAELATLVLIACARWEQRSLVARALAWRPLRVLGTWSYGIYLWHWPIFCVLTPERVHLPLGALMALRLGLTLAIAAASFRWFESPLRRHGLRVARPWLVGSGACAAVVGLLLVSTRPRFASAQPLSLANVFAGEANAVARSVELSSLPAPSALPRGTVRTLVLGDSVAQALGLAMRQLQGEGRLFVAERGVGDCSIMEKRELRRGEPLGHPDPEHGCAARWVRDVDELRPDLTLITIGGGFMAPMVIDGQREEACGDGWQEAYRARLHQLFTEMRPAAGRIVVATAAYPGDRWRGKDTLDWVDCLNDALRTVAGEHELAVLDVNAYLCPDKQCALLHEGHAVRPDGLHPARPGADGLTRWILTQLGEQLALPSR